MKYKQTDSYLQPYDLPNGNRPPITGYGRKLTTPYKVSHNGRLYRVYCVQFSNIGTLYILPNGKPLYLADSSVFYNQPNNQ